MEINVDNMHQATKTVDEWAAEQAGVVFSDGRCSKNFFWECGDHSGSGWSIKKARCQKAFRDWWLKAGDMRQVCFSDHSVIYFDHSLREANEIVAHALNEDGGEEACITAMFNGEWL